MDSKVVERTRDRLAELSRRLLEAIVEEVPMYRHLPVEQLEGEILDVCARNISMFLDALDAGGVAPADELAEIEASAARRAEERIPLEAVLTAYHVGARVAFDAICEDPSVESADDAGELATALLRYLGVISATVSAGYVTERQDIHGEERELRRGLAEALLAGTAVQGILGQSGVTLPPHFAVVIVGFVSRPSEPESDAVRAAVSARRTVRSVEAAVAEAAGDAALVVVDGTGGVLLLPVFDEGPRPDADSLPSVVAETLAAVDSLVGPTLAAASVGSTEHHGVAAACTIAAEMYEVARLAAHPPGLVSADDLLLELAVRGSAEARDRLRTMLDRLAGGPDLLETLEAWFGADFDRRAAAGRLHVHPNTLDYRLRRIRDVTGVDPSTSRGLLLLGAALTVCGQVRVPLDGHRGFDPGPTTRRIPG